MKNTLQIIVLIGLIAAFLVYLMSPGKQYTLGERVWTESIESAIFLNNRIKTLDEDDPDLKARLIEHMFKAYIVDPEKFSRLARRAEFVDLDPGMMGDPIKLDTLYTNSEPAPFEEGVNFSSNNGMIVASVVCGSVAKDALLSISGYKEVINRFIESDKESRLPGSSPKI